MPKNSAILAAATPDEYEAVRRVLSPVQEDRNMSSDHRRVTLERNQPLFVPGKTSMTPTAR